MFDRSFVPPQERGTTCSMENGSGENCAWLQQYSQHQEARSAIASRRWAERRSTIDFRLDAELVHQNAHRHFTPAGQLRQTLDAEDVGFL